MCSCALCTVDCGIMNENDTMFSTKALRRHVVGVSNLVHIYVLDSDQLYLKSLRGKN